MNAPNSNVFGQIPCVGTLDLTGFGSFCQEAMIDPEEVDPVESGLPVKQLPGSKGLPVVEPFTANTDILFGIVVFDSLHPEVGPGRPFTCARENSVMWVRNGDADIEANKFVEYDVLTKSYIEHEEGTDASVVGTTLDAAEANGLMRIQIAK
jgi:hypothetical protein